MEKPISCPVIKFPEPPKPDPRPAAKTKEELLAEYGRLEVLADVYCRTDWEAYDRIRAKLKDLDVKLLNMYDKDNEKFLQNHCG